MEAQPVPDREVDSRAGPVEYEIVATKFLYAGRLTDIWKLRDKRSGVAHWEFHSLADAVAYKAWLMLPPGEREVVVG